MFRKCETKERKKHKTESSRQSWDCRHEKIIFPRPILQFGVTSHRQSQKVVMIQDQLAT